MNSTPAVRLRSSTKKSGETVHGRCGSRGVGHLRVVLGREAADGATVHNVDTEHPYEGAEVEQPAQRDAAGVVPLVHSHLR